MAFVPLFLHGLCSPCMSFHIEPKQLFPPYGPLPESAKPAIDILDLKDLLFSETSIVTQLPSVALFLFFFGRRVLPFKLNQPRRESTGQR